LPEYRIYYERSSGRLEAGGRFTCVTDDEALERLASAKDLPAAGEVELWTGGRLVARVPADRLRRER
jgi:hypothetical protein